MFSEKFVAVVNNLLHAYRPDAGFGHNGRIYTDYGAWSGPVASIVGDVLEIRHHEEGVLFVGPPVPGTIAAFVEEVWRWRISMDSAMEELQGMAGQYGIKFGSYFPKH